MGEHLTTQAVAQPAPQTQVANGNILQRKCACGTYGEGGECDKCRNEDKRLQRKAHGGAGTSSLPPIVHQVLESSGRPLDRATRAFFEPRFGYDFSKVRVHTDGSAAESARAVNAVAYTVGDDVVFDAGKYAPQTEKGSRLLAHELTHVVQQSHSGAAAAQPAKEISDPTDAAEIEADSAASRVLSGDRVQVHQSPSATVHTLSEEAEDWLTGIGVGAAIGGGIAAGFLIAWAAGGFDKETFSDEELKTYLTFLTKNKRIEDGTESDNKARNLVSRWSAGNTPFDLDKDFKTSGGSLTPVELKRLLIKEMLSGPTGESDEVAIITIFSKSNADEIKELLTPTLGLSIQDIENDVSDENLKKLFVVLNKKLPDFGAGQVTRSETPTDQGECTVARAIKIGFAHKRGEDLVRQTIFLMDQFIANPGENRTLQRHLNRFFNRPNQDQIARIRSDFNELSSTLLKMKYVCPEDPFTEFKVKTSEGTVIFKPEEGIPARAAVDLGEQEKKTDGKTTTRKAPKRERTFNVMIFPEYFELSPREQASISIHESFHHAKIQGNVKEYYGSECEGLPTATALSNADSYAQLAMALEFFGPQMTVADCPDAWHAEIILASRTAELWINNAITQVDTVLTDPAKAKPFVINQLKTHFKIEPDAKTELTELRDGLAQIQSGFENIPFECETECAEGEDYAVPGYVLGFLGIIIKSGRIHLCPYWFEHLDHEERAETIAHEMAHRFGGKRGDIYRKAQPRQYSQLTTEEALGNADSYAQFAKVIFNLGSSMSSSSTPASSKENKKLERKAVGPAISPDVPPSVHEVLDSPGQPLDSNTRAWMEPRLGRDFADVRLHTGDRAAESAKEVNAAAYTVGKDIVFGDKQYEPGTPKGHRLLAHELTHVVQQSAAGTNAAQPAKAISKPADTAEVEAEQAATSIATGQAVEVRQTPSATVQSLSTGEAIGVVAGVAGGVGAVLGTLALLGVFDTSKFVDCPKDAPEKINAATKTAETWINNAISKIDSVLALGDKAESFVLEELHQHFKIGPTQKKDLNTLRQDFADIQSGFGRIEFECESDCGSSEELLPGYVNAPLPRRIHLCPDWFAADEIVRAETIAHEMAHRFAGKGEDIAYRKKSMNTYNALPTELALKNADSFSQFAKVLFNIGSSKTSDNKPEKSEESNKLERKASGSAIPADVPPSVHEALNSPAQPLEPATRESMEPRFERDFGHVRVHTNAKAAESAEDVNATAYTVGRDVVLGAGQYAPETSEGRKLLAHELTHVAQQKDSTALSRQELEVDRDVGSEEEADRVAERIAQGGFASESVTGLVETGAIRRQEAEPEADKEPEDTISYEEGGIPNLDPGLGMGGHPPPEDCIDRLWAREFPRVFRLDTISVIGLTAIAASDKKEDVRAARAKNKELIGSLAEICSKYQTVKHPFRVRFYLVDVDLRTPPGDKVETEDGKKNRALGAELGAGQTPKLLVYLEHKLELQEDFTPDPDGFGKKLGAIIEAASTSGAWKGAKTGAIAGGVVGAVAGIGVGVTTGLSLAAGGMGTAAAVGLGALAGLGTAVAGAIVGAAIGALVGHAKGTDRGTPELSEGRKKGVRNWMSLVRAKGEVKGALKSSDADDLARDAVTLWMDDPSALPLTVSDRRLLIKIMLDGPTLDDDERAIIKLLENSTDAEVLQILDTTAAKKERVTWQDLKDNLDGPEWQDAKAMLQARFPSLGDPEIKQTGGGAPNCTADQALMIMEARKRATQIVPIASQRLADFLADPARHEGVRTQLECYFPEATGRDVAQIKVILDRIIQIIPSSKFVCTGPKPLTVETPKGPLEVCNVKDAMAGTPAWKGEVEWLAPEETYVCPPFFGKSPEYQATTIVHEWFHRAAPEHEDFDYSPKCGMTERATALKNAESYALLAFNLAEGRYPTAAGIPSVTIGNFRNTGPPTPENRCVRCPDIPGLGPDPRSGQNFMELTGTIAGHRPDALYDFKRTKEVSVWGLRDGSWNREKFDQPGTLDDAFSVDEDVAPKNDRIYSIDGPGVDAPLPSTGDPSIEGGVYKGNFIETVNVKVGQGPWTPASNSFLWHSVTWFERGTDGLLRRTPLDNWIAPGHITIGPEPRVFGPGDYEVPNPNDGVPV